MWYGGGCDLTPFYIFDEDVAEFHRFWRTLCDRHDPQARWSLMAWPPGAFTPMLLPPGLLLWRCCPRLAPAALAPPSVSATAPEAS